MDSIKYDKFSFTRPHSRQMAHVYYQLFDSKMADGDQLWSVPKLEYDLLRRKRYVMKFVSELRQFGGVRD
jgi:hypothetical protein